jgi:hypothetical protein
MEKRTALSAVLGVILVVAASALQAEILTKPGMGKTPIPAGAVPLAVMAMPVNPFILIPTDTCAAATLPAAPDDGSHVYYAEARYCRVDIPNGARVVRISTFGLDADEPLIFGGGTIVPSTIAQPATHTNLFLEYHSIGSGALETHVSFCQKDSGVDNVNLGERGASLRCVAPDGRDPVANSNSEIVLKMETLAVGASLYESFFQRNINAILPYIKIIKVEYQTAP